MTNVQKKQWWVGLHEEFQNDIEYEE